MKALAAQQFESQKKTEEMSQAEQEELAVRKRREEGTPVTDITFADWWEKWSAEVEEKKQIEKETAMATDNSKDKKNVSAAVTAAAIMEERLTGFQIFSEKAGVFNLEKLEAAAEEMENDTSALPVDEELFDDDDDLDDLDFDSDDDDDDEEDSDDEPDI